MAASHRALDVALVVLGLALGQGDVAFAAAILPVQVDGHKCIALLLDLANQTLAAAGELPLKGWTSIQPLGGHIGLQPRPF